MNKNPDSQTPDEKAKIHSNRKIAVAVSGSGRSLENLLREQETRNYEISAVISSNPLSKGCEIAKSHGIELFCADFSDQIDRKDGSKQNEELDKTESELYKWLESKEITLIALAGFLKKFPLRDAWSERIINIHPALLPKFGGKGMYGINVHKAVISKNEIVSGATIHYVEKVYDQGRIIANTKVDIKKSDTHESLAKKVFQAECKLYPEVIEKLLEGTLPLGRDQIKEYRL